MSTMINSKEEDTCTTCGTWPAYSMLAGPDPKYPVDGCLQCKRCADWRKDRMTVFNNGYRGVFNQQTSSLEHLLEKFNLTYAALLSTQAELSDLRKSDSYDLETLCDLANELLEIVEKLDPSWRGVEVLSPSCQLCPKATSEEELANRVENVAIKLQYGRFRQP